MVASFACHEQQKPAAPVHHHQVARPRDADADRLGHGVGAADRDRSADGNAGRLGGFGVDLPGDLGGLADGWQLGGCGDPLGETLAPGHRLEVDERPGVRCGVSVEHDLARQTKNEVRRRAEESSGLPGQLRLVLAEPEDLGPERLAAQAVAAVGADLLPAVAPFELLDLRGRTGVDPIQDRRPQRPALLIDRYEAWSQSADADGGDPVSSRDLLAELLGDAAQLPPPDAVGVHLSPAGSRDLDLVAGLHFGHQRAVRPAQHALRAVAADVETEEELSHVRPRRVDARQSACRAVARGDRARSGLRRDPAACRRGGIRRTRRSPGRA